jgi:hypothetical protein
LNFTVRKRKVDTTIAIGFSKAQPPSKPPRTLADRAKVIFLLFISKKANQDLDWCEGWQAR